ncbi:MAG: Vms1/Ankzf1 family peptidyl-tRNA hydrolase [Chloroflexota bacterium]
MLTDAEIRQAIEFESLDAPVLSVSLNVDPRRRSADKYKLALRALLDKAKGAHADDIKRIQNYIEMGYNWQGRGVIMFSCVAKDFWWAQSFLPPIEDSVMVSYRPYVRQLAALMDTYERYGVIRVTQEGAHLYAFHMGNLEAAEDVTGEEIKVHKAGGWSSSRYQRHEAELARQNLQEAAEQAEDFYRRIKTRRLIVAGTEKNTSRFQELLSHRLREMVVGQIGVDANAGLAEIREKALELAQQAAEQESVSTADKLITLARKGQNAVLGLTETLTAVQNGRAQHVITLAGFAQPAYRFVDSGYILLELTEESELGSGKLQKLPDAVDSVLRRAMSQEIGVTILDEHQALNEAGQIGAITRY